MELHEQDQICRWFNIRRDLTGKPQLNIYDRFSQLFDPLRSGNRQTLDQYPSFVSFIGHTSVGKSTLLKAMLLIGLINSSGILTNSKGTQDEVQIANLARILESGKYGPVTRSGNIDHLTDPTTFGVHLYKDEGMHPCRDNTVVASQQDSGYCPILFADCEGFRAGNAITNSERSTAVEGHPSDSRSRSPMSTEFIHSRSSSRRRNLLTQLPITASSYGSNGKEGVELFYARFLYAVSDVVVFVTKDDATISKEITHVLEWASTAVFKSVNHPSRKTLIIVRNMADKHDPALYCQEKLKDKYLENHYNLWEDSPILRAFVDDYNSRQDRFARRIHNNQKLYHVLFNNITCCYIPHEMRVNGQPTDLFDQYRNLRKQIEQASRNGQVLRSNSYMKYNVPALTHILNRAFEHFSTSDDPFDFYLAARHDNPNPISASDHIANFLRHAYESADSSDHIDKMVIENIAICLVSYALRMFKEGS